MHTKDELNTISQANSFQHSNQRKAKRSGPVSIYNTPNSARGVAINGNYAYVSDSSGGLLILNINDPVNPTLVGSYDTSGDAFDVVVQNNYAYIADYAGGLKILDISNPANPNQVGQYSIPSGLAYSLTVRNNLAYIACASGGLAIIDISNPANPFLVGSVNTPANKVVVSGDYAYTVYDDSMNIINISDPANPSLTGSFATQNYPIDIILNKNYAYISMTYSKFVIVDVTDPANPSFVTLGSQYTTGMTIHNNYMYSLSSGLYIFDASTPSNPVLLGTIDISSKGNSITVSDNFAYVADGNDGLRIINIASPIPVSIYNTPNFARAVFINGNYAYVSDSSDGLLILNINDPVNPTLVGSYDTSGDAFDVVVQGNYAYIADFAGGLKILDISVPANPSQIGKYSISSGLAFNLFVRDKLAYLACASGGLAIIDISNPTNPFLIGSVNTPANKVVVSGDYAYTVYEDSINIVNISNPANPSLVGSLAGPDYPTNIVLYNNYAFISMNRSYFAMVNVTDPANPSYVTSGAQVTGAITIRDNYVYSVRSNLNIIDISAPLNPVLLRTINIPISRDIDISVSGNFAYVADGYDGLKIISIMPPVLVNNQLDIPSGQTLTLTSDNLKATDANVPANVIIFTLSDITNGQFELSNNPGVAIISFTQQQINDGEIRFVHDGSDLAPSYNIVVSDLYLAASPVAANTSLVRFAPVLTEDAHNFTYSLDQTSLTLVPNITITDADSTELVKAKVAITEGFVPTEDILELMDQSDLSAAYNATSGELHISGNATLADYQTALRSVVYQNIAQIPTVQPRTISFSVSDVFRTSDLHNQTLQIAITPIPEATPQTSPVINNPESNTAPTIDSPQSQTAPRSEVSSASHLSGGWLGQSLSSVKTLWSSLKAQSQSSALLSHAIYTETQETYENAQPKGIPTSLSSITSVMEYIPSQLMLLNVGLNFGQKAMQWLTKAPTEQANLKVIGNEVTGLQLFQEVRLLSNKLTRAAQYQAKLMEKDVPIAEQYDMALDTCEETLAEIMQKSTVSAIELNEIKQDITYLLDALKTEYRALSKPSNQLIQDKMRFFSKSSVSITQLSNHDVLIQVNYEKLAEQPQTKLLASK